MKRTNQLVPGRYSENKFIEVFKYRKNSFFKLLLTVEIIFIGSTDRLIKDITGFSK